MVSSEYYLNIYGGIEYSDIDRLLKRADNIIDCCVITPVEDWQQDYYDKAVCAQAEYIGSQGGIEAYAALSGGGISSMSVGSFSMSSGGSSGGERKKSEKPCPSAVSFLEKGGLTGRYITL